MAFNTGDKAVVGVSLTPVVFQRYDEVKGWLVEQAIAYNGDQVIVPAGMLMPVSERKYIDRVLAVRFVDFQTNPSAVNFAHLNLAMLEYQDAVKGT